MSDHSANSRTQQRALLVLKERMPEVHVPTSAEKDRVLDLLGVSGRFKQSFDALRLHVPSFSHIQSAKDFDLLELKTTAKRLPNLPHGLFFGMTENEEMLLKVFEGKYFLCMVCVHPECEGVQLAGWEDVRKLTQNRRVQYQINLQSKKAAKA